MRKKRGEKGLLDRGALGDRICYVISIEGAPCGMRESRISRMNMYILEHDCEVMVCEILGFICQC